MGAESKKCKKVTKMPLKSIESLELPVVEFDAGTLVLEEGELTSSIYILIEGKVRIFSEDVELLTDDTYGSFFGESAVLLHGPVAASVETITPCKFYHIDHADEYMRQHTELWYSISRVLADRLHHQNQVIVELQHKLHHPEKNKHEHYGKLYQWMVLTNDFFDRDILHPLQKTEKQIRDEELFHKKD